MLLLVLLLAWIGIEIPQVDAVCSYSAPCRLTGGELLKQPEQVLSANGVLRVNLSVEIADFTVDWLTLRRRTYNGQIPSPTWRVKRGNVIQLYLKNNLEYPEKEVPFNTLRLPNTTNIHTHGLHVSPKQPGDDPLLEVRPGGNYSYEFFVDGDHPTGTFWFHPNVHGSSLFQLHSGMAGMIIVEDEENNLSPQLRSVSCPINCQHDVQLIFQPTLIYSNASNGDCFFSNLQRKIGDQVQNLDQNTATSTSSTFNDWIINDENRVSYFTTNGQLHPVYQMQTGQLKRFRMLNAGGDANLELEVVNSRGRHACQIREIATDGVYLDKPRSTKEHHHKSLLVAAGRVDWLISCRAPGNYTLRSRPSSSDSISMGRKIKRFNGVLLKLQVTGTHQNRTVFQSRLPARPHYVSDFRNVSRKELNGFFAVEISAANALNREMFSNPMQYRNQIEVNKLQEWYFLNTNTRRSHPIHLHVNHFQVISYNKYTGPYSVSGSKNALEFFDQEGSPCFYQHKNYSENQYVTIPWRALNHLGHEERWKAVGRRHLGYVASGEFKDTLLVPPLSNITIRFMPHNFTGDLIIESQLLHHKDKGMMMAVEITDKQTSKAKVKEPSGEVHTGACQKKILNSSMNEPTKASMSETTKAKMEKDSKARQRNPTKASTNNFTRAKKRKSPKMKLRNSTKATLSETTNASMSEYTITITKVPTKASTASMRKSTKATMRESIEASMGEPAIASTSGMREISTARMEVPTKASTASMSKTTKARREESTKAIMSNSNKARMGESTKASTAKTSETTNARMVKSTIAWVGTSTSSMSKIPKARMEEPTKASTVKMNKTTKARMEEYTKASMSSTNKAKMGESTVRSMVESTVASTASMSKIPKSRMEKPTKASISNTAKASMSEKTKARIGDSTVASVEESTKASRASMSTIPNVVMEEFTEVRKEKHTKKRLLKPTKARMNKSTKTRKEKSPKTRAGKSTKASLSKSTKASLSKQNEARNNELTTAYSQQGNSRTSASSVAFLSWTTLLNFLLAIMVARSF